MRSEASDSHHNRLAGCSSQHVLVPRDELEYGMCQVYLIKENESTPGKRLNVMVLQLREVL